VSVAGGAAWIADTNHHRIVRFPLGGGAAAPVALAGLAAPAPAPRAVEVDPADPVASLGTLRIAPGKPSPVALSWGLPAGTAVNAESPVRLVWTAMKGLRALPAPIKAAGGEAQRGLSFAVEPAPGAAAGELTGVLQLVTCDDVKHRVCLPVRRTVKASFTVDPAAPAASAIVPLPEAK
jgi:hypothetical protein